jgi:hypothetical protein
VERATATEITKAEFDVIGERRLAVAGGEVALVSFAVLAM